MKFLELGQRLRVKCRVPGGAGTPVKTTGQNDEFTRLFMFINEAWMDLQQRRAYWPWMRASFTFPTVAGKSFYSPAEIGITDFGNWAKPANSLFRSYKTDVGTNSERLLTFRQYENWRDLYLLGAVRNQQTASWEYAFAPDQSLAIGPPPLAGYTVTGHYYRVASELVGDETVPALWPEYHMMIVYRAMMFYASGDAAPEVYAEGEANYNRMLNRLEARDLPPMGFAGALA